ncbi:MAG TPA: sulfatase [Thermoguttaceae bacterium]|nr:sulfatase [Thermoguttaceae bacterium]
MNAPMIPRRTLLGTVALVAAATISSGEARASEKPAKPNILMITCHDLGRHLGCYGVETVRSPNLDALAAEGVRFENYFSTTPTCSAARGSMLTGRYPQSNGLLGLTHAPWWWKFNEGERHLAAILQDAGYDTILVGLQHVTQGDPRSLGYQQVFSKGCQAEETVAVTRTLLREAKPSDRPFFIKVGFCEVHRVGGSFAHRPPDTEKGVYIPPHLKDTEEIRDDLARYQSDIRVLDGYVGEILAALKAGDVAGNTIVVFTSDHGIPYAGAKWSLRDAGLSVPLILHQPGTSLAGGNVFGQLMSNVDLLPTLLDIVGVEIPENIQGVSFKDLIEGKTDRPPREFVYGQRISHALRDNTGRTIRTDRYKLVRYFQEGRSVIYPTDAHPTRVAQHIERPRRNGTRPFVQLFDLQQDPDELHDVAGQPEYAAIVRELSQRLYVWMQEVDDPILKGPIATPYYRESMKAFREMVEEAR